MYITPDSDVYLLESVPLDPSYTNTVLWGDASTQEAWFTGHAVHHFSAVSYQRHAANEIRLELETELAMSCNYMCFINNAFGGKMFYAFITDVTYINNKTCAVTYQIDVLQSFQFDYTLEECWVVREHAATDGYGEHTMPEPVEMGNPIVDSVQKPIDMQNYSILINSTWGSS